MEENKNEGQEETEVKKILVAAGTSLNKMNEVATTVKKMCEERGVAVETIAENLYQVDLNKVAHDLIVLLGTNRFGTDIPMVRGMPFLTKMEMDQAIDEIIRLLHR